jgi:N-acetylglutamate synthase-like GNAT family acetyltransferase
MIRQFQADDADACSNIIRTCIRADPGLSETLREKMEKSETRDAMIERARMYYVAVYESDGGIAGVGALDMNEIRILYVSPEHQRRGIGRNLLVHLESMVPPAVFSDIFVYSSPPSAGFYETLGFRNRGQHLFVVEGEQLATVFMTKRTNW